MGDRRVLLNTVTEVEDMWSPRERRKNPSNRLIERRGTRDQRQRIEIALHRKPVGQDRVRPLGIDSLVEADRIDPRFARIGGEFTPRSLGKTDDRRIGAARLEVGDDARGGGDDPGFILRRAERARPAIEQLQGIDTRRDLTRKIIDRHRDDAVDQRPA